MFCTIIGFLGTHPRTIFAAPKLYEVIGKPSVGATARKIIHPVGNLDYYFLTFST